MKKVSILMSMLLLVGLSGTVFAGNSGVTSEVTEFTASSGKRLKDAVKNTLDDIIVAVDAGQAETGSATNTQAVVFENTYTVAPVVLVETQNATTNSYATSITTTGCTMAMAAGVTNKYIVVAQQ